MIYRLITVSLMEIQCNTDVTYLIKLSDNELIK